MASVLPSRAKRVQQWLLFSRQWHVIDATGQDVWKLGRKIAMVLVGKNKPIYHPETDCGDNVVAVNSRHISMQGFDWKQLHFYYDKLYPKSKAEISAYQIHEYDPCRVLWIATGRELMEITRNHIMQRRCWHRLHLFPDEEMPGFIRKNISHQLEQIQNIPKKSTEYTNEERRRFPRLFKFSDEHVLNRHDNAEPLKWYPDKVHPGPDEK